MASNTIKPYWESTVAMYNMNKTIVESGWIYRLCRLRVVPHFSSGIVERAKRERAWKSTTATRGGRQNVSPFLAWVDFHARTRFARSTTPEEKWGTTRSL